jgi:hypothetical protein
MREYDCASTGQTLEKRPTVKDSVQETRKILCELETVLEDISSVVIGERPEPDKPFEPDCLLTEAKMVVGLAYDALNMAKNLKDSLL